MPLRLASDRSLRDGPLGFFSPRSHWLTSEVVTLRTLANTDWLIWAVSRMPLISSEREPLNRR